jgi:putative MATE family efflux protein
LSTAASSLPRGVTGPIPSELFRLAVPVFLSQLLRVAYQWVDALWVRGLGVEATAAVTTSMFVMWTVYSFGDVIGVGVAAYVSQLLGAGERQRAGFVAYRGLCANAAIGLGCGVLGVLGARHVYEVMHAPIGVVENGARYLSIVVGAAALPMTAFTCETVMRASGNTRIPLAIDACAVLINAVLDPFLIYGWGPFPRLGIAGAAWATVFAQAGAVACYAWIAARRHPALPLSRSAPGPAVRLAALARVGAPSALIGMMFSLVYIAFSRSAARFGSASLAIVGIANRIEAIQFVVGVSIGNAGASLVGQNIGAGRPERAERVIRTGLVWCGWISIALTALILARPEWFVGLFTRDPEALRIGVPYMRILATCLIATGVEMVTFESILGSGHTRVPSIVYNVFSLIRIPLAFWIPDLMKNGVLGIAWLITITCNLRTAVIVAWALRGSWKRGLAQELHAAPAPASSPDANA